MRHASDCSNPPILIGEQLRDRGPALVNGVDLRVDDRLLFGGDDAS